MDVSFDAFGGGNGWGEQGEQEFNNATGTQRVNMFEKIPIPVNINDLLQMPDGEEKYKISSYTFNTIRIVGIIANVQSDQDETCITYELCDPSVDDTAEAPHFTVIRYQGVDTIGRTQTLQEGNYVQAVGKLRSFNNRLSLISFHIHEVENPEEIEIFQLEAKFANIYYNKNFPERDPYQIENIGSQFLSCHGPSGKVGNGVLQQIQNSNSNNSNSNARKLYQESASSNNRGLVGQQAKIYEYIKQNSASDSGVSSDEIRNSIKTDSKFSSDINFLLGEGIIYNTLDEDHFAVIE